MTQFTDGSKLCLLSAKFPVPSIPTTHRYGLAANVGSVVLLLMVLTLILLAELKNYYGDWAGALGALTATILFPAIGVWFYYRHKEVGWSTKVFSLAFWTFIAYLVAQRSKVL